MLYSLIWLPHVLRSAGLKVALVEGWEERGHGDVGTIFGVICHHTATNDKSNMPTLRTLIRGRSDLPGPLSQLGLGRDGTYYVLAAGKCWHAGAGSWQGLTNGNANFIGIEAENTGRANDFPWPAAQMDAYHRGVAAILKHVGRGAKYCAAHREYALPKGRKSDPVFDMAAFRNAVGNIMAGTAPLLVPIPAVEPLGNRPTLRRSTSGPQVSAFVRQLQEKIGMKADGIFGPKTEASLRAFQRAHGLLADGIAGPKTWALFDRVAV